MEESKVELKKCTNCCRAPQPLKEFINAHEKECSTCAKCRAKGKKSDQKPERREAHKVQQKERFLENPENSRQWARTNVNNRFRSIKNSAITRGIEWNLSDEEAKVMMTSPCIYCKHMDLDVRVNGIDRLDSGKSYCTENCRPCCKNCNYMKGTFDPKTFIEHARKISECAELFPGVEICGDHKKNLRKSKDDATAHSPHCAGACAPVQERESLYPTGSP